MYERFVEGRRGQKKLPLSRLRAQCLHFIIRWYAVKPIVKSEDMEWKKSER